MISIEISNPANPSTKHSSEEETWPLALSKGGITVRVYRSVSKKGYNRFTVFYYQDGEEKREVLADENEARARARQVRDLLVKGEVEATNMRLQDVKAYNSALNFLAPTGVSLETACREYAEMLAILKNRASPLRVAREFVARLEQIVAQKSVSEVVEEFLAAKVQGRATKRGGKANRISDRYQYQIALRLRKFAGKVEGPISEVDSEDVNEFILGLKKKNAEALGGRTRNNYAESISVLFEFALKQRYILKECTVQEELEQWAEDDYDIDIFTPDEMKALLAFAPKRLVPVLMLGAFAGLRTAEIARLDWSEVKFDSNVIEVKARKAKTRARRLPPLCDNLATLLQDHRKDSGPIWDLSLVYLHELQAEAAAKAGVLWKHNALRHSFISYRVAAIQNVQQVALEAGNSPDIIFQHYRELVAPKIAAQWFAITPEVVKAFAEAKKKETPAKEVLKILPEPVQKAA